MGRWLHRIYRISCVCPRISVRGVTSVQYPVGNNTPVGYILYVTSLYPVGYGVYPVGISCGENGPVVYPVRTSYILWRTTSTGYTTHRIYHFEYPVGISCTFPSVVYRIFIWVLSTGYTPTGYSFGCCLQDIHPQDIHLGVVYRTYTHRIFIWVLSTPTGYSFGCCLQDISDYIHRIKNVMYRTK